MKTVNLVQSISRAGGGLFYSVRRLTESIKALPDMDIAVHSLRDEFSDEDIESWRDIRVVAHRTAGPKIFGYAPAMLEGLMGEDAELVHAHGVWMYPSVVATRWQRRTQKPYLISPHGMLDPWAVRNSRWKKALAHLLYESRFQGGAACLRALCVAEAEGIRKHGSRNPIVVIPNGVDLPAQLSDTPPDWHARIPAGKRTLLYLGRIHPKKNLQSLLHAWSGLSKRYATVAEGWHLVIAGWDQGGYQAQLMKLAGELAIESSISFVGPQYDEAKHRTLSATDAFVLPSLSEGLPMAVLEAWAYRLPVAMTSECNIPKAFEVDAAVQIGTTASGLEEGLAGFLAMADADRVKLGIAGRLLTESDYAWEAVASQMDLCYRWILGGGPPPPSLT